MLRILRNDVLIILLYVVASLVVGAVLAPWIYNAGMGLAEVTKGRETTDFLGWIGAAAERSKDDFARFYSRALLLSAVVLLFPLLALLRAGRSDWAVRDTPWSLRLPDSMVNRNCGQPLRRNPWGGIQLVWGFVLAGSLLLISGWLMVKAGFFVWRDAEASVHGVANRWVVEIDWGGAIKKAILSAAAAAVIEEIFYRGILLGIFLRSMRPAMAIGSLSLLFAFLHFLEPPPGVKVPDPEALNAGFVLLGQVFERFLDPVDLLGRFSVLVATGVVLAVARWRTASLWLPMGIHGGWVFCILLFKAATWPVAGLPESVRWMVGSSIVDGVLPLVVVIVTGIIVAIFTKPVGDDF